MGQKSLDANHLTSLAEAETGLAAWGSDLTFREGLGRLIASAEDLPFADKVRDPLQAELVRLLATRLRLEDDAARHPAILLGRVDKPLIVTGMPRTGTTWLFELLSLDPATRAPLDWEVAEPWPAPEAATFETDPRIARVQGAYEAMLKVAPELATMHNFHAQLPQECNSITTLHFASSNFWASYDVPDYLRWLSFETPQGVFNTHRRMLQQLQWKGPRGRWLLKSPPHLLMLEDLLAAYPDACLVQTHREPTRIVASLGSMIRALRRVRFPDVPELLEPKAIARSVLLHFGQALEQGTQSRENPTVDRRFVDVAYRDTISAPLTVLRRIYDHFDLPWTEVFERRVTDHLAAERQTGHGAHKYSLEEFGVPELDIPSQFPNYRARFGDLLSDH